MIPSKLTPQLVAPSPPPDARQVVTLMRTQTEQAIRDAAESRVQTSEEDCGAVVVNPLDGSSPPPDASGLTIGWTRTLDVGVSPVTGNLNGGATCFDADGRPTNATCPDRGAGFGLTFTDGDMPPPGGLAAIVGSPTPEVQTAHVVAGYGGAASMTGPQTVAEFGADAGGVQPGGRYSTLPSGTVSGVPSVVGPPLDLARTGPVWPTQYALRTYWDGSAMSYRASSDLRTQPFRAIAGAPTPDGDEYLTVRGRYGYATNERATVIHAFDLEALTYLGATALPSGHLGYSPCAVSPDGASLLCTTYDYPVAGAPQAWIEVFSVASGVLTHQGSVSIQHPSNVYGCGDIAFASDGTAYLTSSRNADATIAPGFYVAAPPYTSATFHDLSALFVDPTYVALYGIVLTPSEAQVLIVCMSQVTDAYLVIVRPDGTSGVLLDLGAAWGGGGVAISPNGLTACIGRGAGVVFVAGPSFAGSSSVGFHALACSQIHRISALSDGSGFLMANYPFYYVLEAPFTAGATPWAVPDPGNPTLDTNIAI